MGSSPSKSAVDNATPNHRRASSRDPAQQIDARNAKTVKRGLVSQPLHVSTISAKVLAARKKILHEFPELAGSVAFVKKLMNQLDENIEADAKTNTMTLSSKKNMQKLQDFYYEHEPMEHKKILGDEIAAGKGGRIFTDYMRALSPRNSDNSNKAHSHYRKECLRLLKSVCWSYSDASSEFCLALGREGCFQIIVDEIKNNIDPLKNKDERHESSMLSNLSILHNCGKFGDNKKYLNEADALEALVPLLEVDESEIKMMATLTVAYIIEEKDNYIISTDNHMVKSILRYLEVAIASQDHECDGFRAEEIVLGLMHLASNDENKRAIVNEGLLPMLTELMKKGDESEKFIAAKTIWVLSFRKRNRRKIRKSEGLIDTLKKLSASEGPWKMSASGAIWVLEEDRRFPNVISRLNSGDVKTQSAEVQGDFRDLPLPRSEPPLVARARTAQTPGPYSFGGKSGTDSSGAHIMISYQWDFQKLVIKLANKLERVGYRVWIDIKSMSGSTIEGMADAVEKSAIVLMCMSRTYKDSPNCRTEAGYAFKLGKTLIPIIVERGYESDGWLGLLQGTKVCFDFSDLAEFKTAFTKLTKEIGTRAKIASKPIEEPIFPAKQPDLAHPAGPLIKNWTSNEVKEWISINNVHMKNLSSFDGEILLFLKNLKDTAPEFYYRFLHDRMGVTELRSFMNLNNALEALI